MGIFDIFKTKKPRDPRLNHDLDPEEQQSGAETTASKGELNRLRIRLQMEKAKLEAERDSLELKKQIIQARQDLEDLEDDSFDDEDQDSGSNNSLEAALIGLLGGALAPKQAPQSTITQSADTTATPDGEPTNEELRTLWQKLPQAYKDQASAMMKK